MNCFFGCSLMSTLGWQTQSEQRVVRTRVCPGGRKVDRMGENLPPGRASVLACTRAPRHAHATMDPQERIESLILNVDDILRFVWKLGNELTKIKLELQELKMCEKSVDTQEDALTQMDSSQDDEGGKKEILVPSSPLAQNTPGKKRGSYY